MGSTASAQSTGQNPPSPNSSSSSDSDDQVDTLSVTSSANPDIKLFLQHALSSVNKQLEQQILSDSRVASSNNWHEGFKLCIISSGDERYDWIAKKMSKTIVSHNGVKIGGYEILEIHQVKNSTLWRNYTRRRAEIKRETDAMVDEVRLFHGSAMAENIARNGFKLELAKSNGMFGKAIYFADLSSKSNQYTFEGCNQPCKMHRDALCDKCERTMLVCRVALGRVHKAERAMNHATTPPSGFHCVLGEPGHCRDTLNYKEYAIYHNNQAYPGYLVKYKIKK